ncbi:FtsX-like permease family protein [Asanoa iriomotensis]|uniref:ABC3 transporter permease C-terminal domain-containing protein n=1 Tax=Asanoa iriomotensis TaxID=234613 RepID=A0ABQ4BWJ1_9ACTN|nr:ABC transporter permease [Asanoa iriomotensis]GIF54415.1 hypothetical protein Air01nite_05100 [Asanoa iriomotensis]
MNALVALRLAVAGGREQRLRRGFTAAGIGVAGALLLLAFSAPNAAFGRAERISWQDAATAVVDGEVADPPAEKPDGALFLAVSDYYDGTPMTRAYVAALGADPPVPPGIDRLPGPGEIAVSPALRRLLAATPGDQLDDRFPGRDTMTIGPAGLAHDNELVAIIGRTPDQLRGVGSVAELHGFFRSAPRVGVLTIQAAGIGVGTVFVLVPVLFLLVIVTRVAAGQQDRRLASLRLVGATRAQTALVAATETGLAAGAGTLLAWGGYELGRRVLAATVVFQRGHFWVEDVRVPGWELALVLAGLPALAVATTLASLWHVQLSPLSVQRRARRAPPTAWTALPLGVGVAGLLALVPLRDRVGPETLAQLRPMLALLSVAGVVLVGPWLCLRAARGVARLSRRAPALLAARRIAYDPRATFRAVAAVALAAMAAAYLGSTADRPGPPVGEEAKRIPAGVVRVNTGGMPLDLPLAVHRPGTDDYDVPYDGSLAGENRVRGAVAELMPNAIVNTDRDPVDYHLETLFADFDRLGGVAALFVLVIGACGLTAGVIGGLAERRRPFALLRASGVRLGELRLAILVETVATMLVTSLAGVALGLVAAYATTRAEGLVWTGPGLPVLAAVGAGMLAALVFALFALPLVGATTRHDAVRYE